MPDKMRAPKGVANFDSAWGMLRALANCLSGKDFPGIGILPQSKAVAFLVDNVSRPMGRRLYALAGWLETISTRTLSSIQAEDIARTVISLYPKVSPQAVMIGSANGAMVHLCAALGAPWLPQTFMIPVRRRMIHPDEVLENMEWGRETAPPLLNNNPELVLHHAHDPDHDRLMVRRMSYFRVKRTSLGESYSRFLEEKFRSGATVYLVECRFKWLAKQVAERHYFQLGGAGGISPEEYVNGSHRVTGFLEREGSPKRRWNAAPPDVETPEGEWGFQPQLAEEVIALGRKVGGRVVRISFDDPEDMSPLVADFYRWWYARRGIPCSYLLTGSFIFLDPYWTLRTGSVPYWMVFNGQRSAGSLSNYLTRAEPYDYLYKMLLSNGVNPVEGVSIDDWRSLARHASIGAEFLGVNEERFPYDFASFLRYNAALQKKIPFRHDMPAPASLDELHMFLQDYGDQYQVQFVEAS